MREIIEKMIEYKVSKGLSGIQMAGLIQVSIPTYSNLEKYWKGTERFEPTANVIFKVKAFLVKEGKIINV
jgi:transcriptional regulator with XRE-family HTH domain